MRIGSGGFI